jgi:hypothetical protein
MVFSDDWIELHGHIEATSMKAILFQADYWEKAEWLPRSQIEIISQGKDEEDREQFTVRVKEWLARKNGWNEL